MAKHRAKKQNRQSRKAELHRRVGRVIGLSGATSTFITFSLAPPSTMPVAKADGIEDIIIDPIINSLSGIDPALALDMTSWLSSLDAALSGASNFDPSSLDAAWSGASNFDPSSLDSAWSGGVCLRSIECGRQSLRCQLCCDQSV